MAKKKDKYELSKGYKEVARELNKAYDEMKQMRFNTNAIRQFEQTLERFYENNDIDVANVHHITTRKQMTKEQAEELAGIVDMFTDIALNEGGFYYSDIEQYLTEEDKQRINDVLSDMDYDSIETEFDEDEEEPKMNFETFDFSSYQTSAERYGLNSVQEYLSWLEGIMRLKDNALIREILSSDQYAEILAYSQETDLTFNDILSIMVTEYGMTGKTGEPLYDTIIDRIKTRR